ncbi:phage portal protein [Heyndrickxia sporothermodurans]|uniref:phage portal protein n=1 Tax=Heyndrickxia sporothermodurans TaxID=46224 RepID=UPI000D34C83A|nr:phage portal protein [Heyndrickxia sporothermodurans]PTY79627.1 phage portal protein [Heyndrickxia sporothermodurans]
MGFFNWIKSWGLKDKVTELEPIVISLLASEIYKRIAVDSCINLIANALVRCEFKTIDKGKSVKADNYYLLNVSPNKNENATEFKKKMVSKLFRENECLIVMANDQLFIADSFTVEEYVMKDSVYSDVTVGDFQFSGSFFESEVIYLKLNDKDIMKVINGFYKDYGSLLASAKDIYKRSNAKRFVLKGDFLRSQRNPDQERIDEMMNEQFKPWLEADNAGAIFNLQKGYELEDASGNGKSGTNKQDSRDVRNLVDDVLDFVATAFHVPRGLLKGDVVDVSSQTNNFLMFCINPLVELISAEINKKMYGKSDFLRGTYLKIDTTKIKVTDLNDMATALDKLFAIGALSINDIIEMTGGERINEEWANRRYVTKNYIDARQNQPLEGGDS